MLILRGVLLLIICAFMSCRYAEGSEQLQGSLFPANAFVIGSFETESRSNIGIHILERIPEAACDVIELKNFPAYKNSVLFSPVFEVAVIDNSTGHSEGIHLPPPLPGHYRLYNSDFLDRKVSRTRYTKQPNQHNKHLNDEMVTPVRMFMNGRYVYTNGREYLSFIPAAMAEDSRDTWIIGNKPGIDNGFAFVKPGYPSFSPISPTTTSATSGTSNAGNPSKKRAGNNLHNRDSRDSFDSNQGRWHWSQHGEWRWEPAVQAVCLDGFNMGTDDQEIKDKAGKKAEYKFKERKEKGGLYLHSVEYFPAPAGTQRSRRLVRGELVLHLPVVPSENRILGYLLLERDTNSDSIGREWVPMAIRVACGLGHHCLLQDFHEGVRTRPDAHVLVKAVHSAVPADGWELFFRPVVHGTSDGGNGSNRSSVVIEQTAVLFSADGTIARHDQAVQVRVSVSPVSTIPSPSPLSTSGSVPAPKSVRELLLSDRHVQEGEWLWIFTQVSGL